MKRGFTLVELLTVLIIVGILGTLGLAQYSRTIEKSRIGEAKDVFAHIRKLAAIYYQEKDTTTGFVTPMNNIGAAMNQYPGVCRATHWFRYSTLTGGVLISIVADRCGGGAMGLGRDGASSYATVNALVEAINFATGTDVVTPAAVYQ